VIVGFDKKSGFNKSGLATTCKENISVIVGMTVVRHKSFGLCKNLGPNLSKLAGSTDVKYTSWIHHKKKKLRQPL
jgi:hypothetical protein